MTTDSPVTTVSPEEFLEFIARPDLRADPYPQYAKWRSVAPLANVAEVAWVVTGHDQVAEILRDDRFSTDERKSPLNTMTEEELGRPFSRIYHNMMLFQDEPDHKRLRDLVQKAFTRRMVEDLRGRIDSLVDDLVTSLVGQKRADLMSTFAYRLPVIVICEMLGVPPADWDRFQTWARDLAFRFEVQPMRTPEMEKRGDEATQALVDYFEDLIAEKRKDPRSDLISSLMAVEDAGDKLTHQELLANLVLILLAGHETTANLIGNGAKAFMENRDQWERLVAEPELARGAVEELLRYDPPVQIVLRIPLADVEIEGQTIPSGHMVTPVLGAANRDPAHYIDPDRLDITRNEAPLVSFGGGVHFCLGAPLARLEAQTAFRSLAQRVPNLELDGEPTWRPSFVIRGLEELPVRTG